MGVAILPYHMKSLSRLADVSLGDLIWPLESSPREGTIRDLTDDDHLVVSPGSRRLYFPPERLDCSISVCICEPYAVHRRHYLAMYLLWPRFFRVISRCPKLAGRLPNARTLILTRTWIEDPDAVVDIEKTKSMSLIASGKRSQVGHRLRHDVAAWIDKNNMDVDLLGSAFRRFDKKEEGLAPYRFSVVIENTQEPAYFSEKLIDCFICGTIPIYWGAPDVSQYFRPEGMVICRDAKDIQNAITSLDESDFQRMSQHAAENRERALKYIDQERLVAELIQDEASMPRSAAAA